MEERYCENCNEEMDRDCNGEERCPNCDGPCPCCYDGGGPGGEERYRVSYFSAWRGPQHFEDLSVEEKDEIVENGKGQQFKVVVTTMEEEVPVSFE